jgi:hypothetical protein
MFRFINSKWIWCGGPVLIGIITLVLLFASHSNWTQKNYEETVRRGNEIVAALDAYRLEHQAYPKTIEELRPVYFKEILPPLVGNEKWQYFNNSGGIEAAFSLMVGEYSVENDPETGPIMWYSPETKEWLVDTR